MSFLSNLFKRKVGGTAVGNALRVFAGAYTGGAMGNGRMMITDLEADKRDLSEADFVTKYGMTKALAVPGTLPKSQYRNNNNNPIVNPMAMDLFLAWLSRNWYVPVLIIAIPLSFFVVRRQGNRYGR